MHVYTLHDATSKAIMRVSSCMYTVYIQVHVQYVHACSYLFTHIASYKIKLRISITTESPNVTSCI